MVSLEQTYAYRSASRLDRVAGDQHLSLVSEGVAEGPFLEAFALMPQVTARGLRTVSEVVGARYYVPPAMLARILREADPVATVSPGAVRFEGFSACCSCYVRLDLDDAALHAARRRNGTVNVDFGADLRAALAVVGRDDRLGLSIGPDAVGVTHEETRIVERRVPLPLRWIRGFAEVQVAMAGMAQAFTLPRVAAQRFLHQLPRGKNNQALHVEAVGGKARVLARPGPASVPLRGAERLRVLEPLVALAERLEVHLNVATGASAWVLEFGAQRLVLVLNADPWRGFSGDGGLLRQLAVSDGRAAALLRAQLNWQSEIDEASLARATGLAAGAVRAGLAELAAVGLVGYDLRRQGYFHRVLPFDMERIAGLNPRLVAAQGLLDQGAVTLTGDGAEVRRGAVVHRVTPEGDGWRCTCPWYAKHGDVRGPCKHMLAVEMMTEAAP